MNYRHIPILSVALLSVLFMCKSEETEGTFTILPTPQEFEITGISNLPPILNGKYYSPEPLESSNSNSKLVYSIDSTLDVAKEGYKLVIEDNQIILKGKDKAGIIYGLATLEQINEDAVEQGVNLPKCEITDYPLLSYRAVHLDMKHHMERKEYYYQMIDKLAKYKVNAIIAEVEDKIKYVRQPEVGSADALSIEEWVEISNYAMDRNIEISPLVQGLGHASFILKHDIYKELRDDPTNDWSFNPLDPKTYDVQFDLYLDAIDATPHGKYLHVGGDEVHTTGRNSGKSQLELQLIWLNKVSKFAEEHGRIPIFWDDMPLKHAGVYQAMFKPELSQESVDSIWTANEHNLLQFLDQFPKNCIYMRWNYSYPQSLGNIRAMDWFRSKDLQVMGATAGQQRWVLMPQNGGNIDNIRSFALSSIESDLNGLLLTLWDDDSPHFELYWRGIISFAEYTWAGDRRSIEDAKEAYRHREFSKVASNPKFAFIDELEHPVAFWKNALLEGNNRNNIRKLTDPWKDVAIQLPDLDNKGSWSAKYQARLEMAKENQQRCDSIQVKIDSLKAVSGRNQYSLEVYEQVNAMARFAPTILITLQALDQAENQVQIDEAMRNVQELAQEFHQLRNEFESVYSKTRVLTKPEGYILDQDHHAHLANQTTSFEWQFGSELLLFEKIERELLPTSMELQ